MTPVCTFCDATIDTGNRGFPGFCSADCRDRTRAVRDRAAADLAQRRADRRQHAEAHKTVRYYLT